MQNKSVIDILIENIKTDQKLLETTEVKMQQAKDEKREVADRLKDYRRDVETFLKYADQTQREKIEALGFNFTKSAQGLNPAAQLAYDIIVKAKGNEMTNEQLYLAYVKTFKNKDDAFNYTEFNIKCRTLFNTQRLLRRKGDDPKSSRRDSISLNGRIIKKEEPKNNEKKISDEAVPK